METTTAHGITIPTSTVEATRETVELGTTAFDTRARLVFAAQVRRAQRRRAREAAIMRLRDITGQ